MVKMELKWKLASCFFSPTQRSILKGLWEINYDFMLLFGENCFGRSLLKAMSKKKSKLPKRNVSIYILMWNTRTFSFSISSQVTPWDLISFCVCCCHKFIFNRCPWILWFLFSFRTQNFFFFWKGDIF